ncbi:MAG: twin-arginine translocation signal domain-containing protein [Thermodesulfovibrionales bacterium]
MAITRRDFLKSTAVAGAALLFGVFDLNPIVVHADVNPPVWTQEATTVCGYCSVGCSMIAGTPISGTLSGYVTYIQGNPDSPINKGALCSKGAASAQFSTVVDSTGTRIPNTERLTAPMYRGKKGTGWTTITWQEAIDGIAAKVYATRNATFTDIGDGTPDPSGLTVNRCTGIATLGGSSLNNEAAYLITKLNRALGVVHLETQARN